MPTNVRAQTLPAGRRGEGGLTKDEVVLIQRSRMLFAMAEAVADVGYANVVVSDVVKRAGVSRATFYEQFTDKQDCFLAAFDTASEVIFGEVGTIPEGLHEARLATFLAGYLENVASHEAFARVFLIDIYGVGPEGARRRAESQHRISAMLSVVFGLETERDRFACEALVAATSAMVTAKLAVGDLEGLRALQGPLYALAQELLNLT